MLAVVVANASRKAQIEDSTPTMMSNETSTANGRAMPRQRATSAAAICSQLAAMPTLKLTLVHGRNLVAADLNGAGDAARNTNLVGR